MNKLFGFFKEKIVQANVQNKKDIQTIVNAITGEDSSYKSDAVMANLQKIKNNYMTWSILIANQASTGLYYSQLHNHSVCLKKAANDKQFQKTIEKNKITQQQIKRTHQQLIQISQLNQNWVQSVSQNIQNIKRLRQKSNQEKKLLKQTQQTEKNKLKTISEQQLAQQNNSYQQAYSTESKSEPITITSIMEPIISFTQQNSNNSQIIISSDRW